MGSMFYGAPQRELVMDDVLLAHMQVLIIAKLRRNESFLLSWTEGRHAGSGRRGLWMHREMDLYFEFAGNGQPTIDQNKLENYSISASSNQGVDLKDQATARR